MEMHFDLDFDLWPYELLIMTFIGSWKLFLELKFLRMIIVSLNDGNLTSLQMIYIFFFYVCLKGYSFRVEIADEVIHEIKILNLG